MADTCNNSGTINTSANNNWTGRSATQVTALNTWQTLYKGSPQIDINPWTGKYQILDKQTERFTYVKQIYIHNCNAAENVAGKEFSVRIYNPDSGVITIVEENLVFTAEPAECVLVNRLLIPNGGNISILTSESPLKLGSVGDEIQFQSHTSLTGFTISLFMEPWSAGYNERDDNPRSKANHADPNSDARTGFGQAQMKIGRVVTGTPDKTTPKEIKNRDPK